MRGFDCAKREIETLGSQCEAPMADGYEFVGNEPNDKLYQLCGPEYFIRNFCRTNGHAAEAAPNPMKIVSA
jgi:hypothetical protein